MANFPPFRNYLFYCLDKIIRQYDLRQPFLDVGCGEGHFSYFLGSRGWAGKAIDLSPAAIRSAQKRLAEIQAVSVELNGYDAEKEKYRTIFLLDILEHIQDDRHALKAVSGLLAEGGSLVLAVPSNPRCWGWDDDFYGHVRRYTLPEIEKKLQEVGLKIVIAWDFTYPFFYFLRWLYLKLNPRNPNTQAENLAERTDKSGLAPEWQQTAGSTVLTALAFAWLPLYWLMFTFFKSNVLRGHEMIVLARSSK